MKLFQNSAPPFPYKHLKNGNDMPLRSALTQTGTTCGATHVAWPFPLAWSEMETPYKKNQHC